MLALFWGNIGVTPRELTDKRYEFKVESGDINTDLGHRENLSDVLETLDE